MKKYTCICTTVTVKKFFPFRCKRALKYIASNFFWQARRANTIIWSKMLQNRSLVTAMKFDRWTGNKFLFSPLSCVRRYIDLVTPLVYSHSFFSLFSLCSLSFSRGEIFSNYRMKRHWTRVLICNSVTLAFFFLFFYSTPRMWLRVRLFFFIRPENRKISHLDWPLCEDEFWPCSLYFFSPRIH